MKADQSNAQAVDAPTEKKGGLCKSFLVVNCLIMVMIVAAVAIVNVVEAMGTASGEAAVNNRPAVQVCAQDLAAAYESDEVVAEQRYGRRALDVTGTAIGLTQNFSDEPFLVLEGPKKILGPEAQLTVASQAKAASLIKGTQVRLHCSSVSKVVGIQILDHCDIL